MWSNSLDTPRRFACTHIRQSVHVEDLVSSLTALRGARGHICRWPEDRAEFYDRKQNFEPRRKERKLDVRSHKLGCFAGLALIKQAGRDGPSVGAPVPDVRQEARLLMPMSRSSLLALLAAVDTSCALEIWVIRARCSARVYMASAAEKVKLSRHGV